MIEERTNLTAQILALPPDPDFPVDAALYFLDGHYLFRRQENNRLTSKFLTAADLAAAFTNQEHDSGWMAPGIVRIGSCARGPWFVYSSPAQKVLIHLAPDESLTIPIPRLVLLGVQSDYYIWAIKESGFSATARAYCAPFPNVHPGGKICWGQNTPPQASPEKARGVWELFFGSLFNGDLAADKSIANRGDVRVTLRGLADKNRYPHDDLVTEGSTIDYLVKGKIGGA